MKRILLFNLVIIVFTGSAFCQTPEYEWTAPISGSSVEEGLGIASDANGNVISTGYFDGTVDFDPDTTVSNLSSNSNSSDIYIQKLDNKGKLVWATNIGGATADEGRSVATDINGNIYLTGYFTGTVDFDPGVGTNTLTAVGNRDAFILKLDAAGNYLWAKGIEGASDVIGISITTDTAGNVYSTGVFKGSIDIDPGAGTSNLSSAGNFDVYFQKLDASGNLVWGKQIGTTTSEQAKLAVDLEGNVYSTGYFEGTVDFDPGAGNANLTANGSRDVFVLKLNSSGNFVWAKHVGGGQNDEGNAIITHPNGSVHVTGFYQMNVDFDPGAGNDTLRSKGSADAFVWTLDSAGNHTWAKTFGSTNEEYGNSISVDNDANIYIGGLFSDTVDFDPGTGQFDLISNGFWDSYLLKLDSLGAFIWAGSFGGNAFDFVNDISVDANKSIYSVGDFESPAVDFHTGTGIDTVSALGFVDAFVHKLKQCSPKPATINPSTCGGSYTSPSGTKTFTISGTYSDTIPTANGCDSVLTINLTITNIDTATSVSSGTISATMSGASYQWLDCGNGYTIISGATSQSYAPAANGSYAVQIAKNGCIDTSKCNSVINIYVIDQGKRNIVLRSFPNPVSTTLTLTTSENVIVQYITATNQLGQIFKLNFTTTGQVTRIETSSLAKGIYYLTLTNNKGDVASLSFVKE